ncbi:MAG: hypothetical protein H0U10_03770, partial [Chloroflexia bacterium]|nr:hypothetical protein [Chloroflexia bacterium]
MIDAARQPQPNPIPTPSFTGDGLVALYAARVLDRGADPRVLVGASRAARWGSDRSRAAAEPG